MSILNPSSSWKVNGVWIDRLFSWTDVCTECEVPDLCNYPEYIGIGSVHQKGMALFKISRSLRFPDPKCPLACALVPGESMLEYAC